MRIAYVCTAVALVMACIMPSQAIMQFSYICEGENATATTYTYLKEPRIVETGFERGLKSNSFNYLENGKIDLRENINYFYGNATNISNSTVDHTLEVKFEGDRGISEFFGRGFFGNNRWISAWKKIRYEESPSMKIDGWNMVPRPSNSIDVVASVFMNSSENASSTYIFDYNAKIKNGVIETKDAAGWTNRSGSRKYDWESETRTVGKKLDITNKLIESEGLITANPPNDWLPCCYSGTMPTITMRFDDDPWPSEATIATLEANRLLPTRSLSKANSIPSNDSPSYWKREIQIGLSSRPSVPVYDVEVSAMGLRKDARPERGGIVALKANQLLPTMHLSNAYAPSISYPVYWKREAQIGLRSLLPAVVPVQMTANSSPSVQSQEKTDSSLFASAPAQNPANCIGDNCPANFFVSKNQSDLSCKEGVCDGFDCIYTYDEDSEGGSVSKTVLLRSGDTRNIYISAEVFEISDNESIPFYSDSQKLYAAEKERYKITVRNSGDVPLSDVSVTAEMAKGMKYSESVPPVLNPPEFDERINTEVKWNLGTMQPNQTQTILMETYQKKDLVDKTDLSVKAVGTAPDGLPVTKSVSNAETQKCIPPSGECTSGEELLFKLEGKPELCKKTDCPKWTWSNQSIQGLV